MTAAMTQVPVPTARGTALRENADGSTYTSQFSMTRVE